MTDRTARCIKRIEVVESSGAELSWLRHFIQDVASRGERWGELLRAAEPQVPPNQLKDSRAEVARLEAELDSSMKSAREKSTSARRRENMIDERRASWARMMEERMDLYSRYQRVCEAMAETEKEIDDLRKERDTEDAEARKFEESSAGIRSRLEAMRAQVATLEASAVENPEARAAADREAVEIIEFKEQILFEIKRRLCSLSLSLYSFSFHFALNFVEVDEI